MGATGGANPCNLHPISQLSSHPSIPRCLRCSSNQPFLFNKFPVPHTHSPKHRICVLGYTYEGILFTPNPPISHTCVPVPTCLVTQKSSRHMSILGTAYCPTLCLAEFLAYTTHPCATCTKYSTPFYPKFNFQIFRYVQF